MLVMADAVTRALVWREFTLAYSRCLGERLTHATLHDPNLLREALERALHNGDSTLCNRAEALVRVLAEQWKRHPRRESPHRPLTAEKSFAFRRLLPPVASSPTRAGVPVGVAPGREFLPSH